MCKLFEIDMKLIKLLTIMNEKYIHIEKKIYTSNDYINQFYRVKLTKLPIYWKIKGCQQSIINNNIQINVSLLLPYRDLKIIDDILY